MTTQIHAPDVTTLNSFNSLYADTICQDSVARGYVDRLATHPYGGDFWNPDGVINEWVTAHNLASGYGKQLWQTEYAAGGTWNHALAIVQHVYNALAHGRVSAWLCYELYKTGGGGGGVIGDSGPYPTFYALKQYFRYVRPGAVRIEASCSDPDLLVTAFEHRAQNTVTLVMINRDTTAKTINCSLNSLPPVASLSQYRTSSTENCINVGTIPVLDGSFSATVPPDSITTFTGTEEVMPFRVTDVSYTQDGATIEWSAVPGRGYQVYSSPELQTWSPLSKILRPPAGSGSLFITDRGSHGLAKRFYKVAILP